MTAEQFNPLFARLEAVYHPSPPDRDAAFAEWFSHLHHFDPTLVSSAISSLIRSKSDHFWPTPATLLSLIHSTLASTPTTTPECPHCHNTTWIDAPPMKSHGRIYTFVMRCPHCKTPPPKLTRDFPLEPLTPHELQLWTNHQHPQQTAPHTKPTRTTRKSIAHTPK